MKNIIEAINRPSVTYKHQRKEITWLFVSVTILANVILEPMFRIFRDRTYSISSLPHMFRIAIYGMVSYFLMCAVLYFICKLFGSQLSFITCIKTWGISFAPNILCALVVSYSEEYFYLFSNSMFWGMIFSVIYMGILFWKILLLVIFLQDVALLSKKQLIGAFMVIAILVGLLAALNGFMGLKTPIL